jgi:hypothetical protein
MHPFAPKKPAFNSGHPGDEGLAAYVDGMLEGEEKARVVEHLASCADCYRVYSETLRFQWEEEGVLATTPASEEAAVVPFPSDRKVKSPWLPAAAAAVVLAGVGAWLFTLFGPAPELTTADLVAPLPKETRLGSDLWQGQTFRSGGGGEESVDSILDQEFDNERRFQIGVQLVNLQVSLEQNDGAAADDVLPRLLILLQQNPIPLPEYEQFYSDVRVAISKGASPRSFLEESSAKSEELRELLDAPYLQLGRVTAAGRLAAITQEPSFFERRSTRRLVRDILRLQEKGDLDIKPAAQQSLKDILMRMEKGKLRPSDHVALQKDFEVILQKYYPQTRANLPKTPQASPR